ncbi:uncharacterized protein LOC143358332 [Halictus rubicundus]|uniref:uncharacterized protein LOC143358332 n=1 Tax=Halictus rubicundus TaxID=77578 RepID=UPI004035E77B
MWMLYVVLVAAVFSGSLDAFPQDGFVFDGPFSGGDRTTRATTTTGSTTTARTDAGDNTECVNNCPRTLEYNPLCGTDMMLYSNPGHLNCAVMCGKDVRINYYGPCRSSGARG